MTGADNTGSIIPTFVGAGVGFSNGDSLEITPDAFTVSEATSDKLAKDDFIKRANGLVDILTKVVPESQKRVDETIKIADEVAKLSDEAIIDRIAKLNDVDAKDEAQRAQLFNDAKKLTGKLAKYAGSSAVLRVFSGVNKAAHGYIAVGGKFVK